MFCCRVRIVMLMCWLWRFRAAPVSVHIFYGVTAATKLWHSCDKIRRQHLCTAATKSRDKILASPRQNICIAATKYLHRRDKIFASMLQNYCFAATKSLQPCPTNASANSARASPTASPCTEFFRLNKLARRFGQTDSSTYSSCFISPPHWPAHLAEEDPQQARRKMWSSGASRGPAAPSRRVVARGRHGGFTFRGHHK